MLFISRFLRGFLPVALLCSIVAGLLGPEIAFAHERRSVGKYQLVVGFLTEPALSGQPNGLSLAVTDTETNQPVEGLEKTLKAEIIHGSNIMEVALRAQFQQPGRYKADMIPTRSGTYVFHFFGEIEGLKIDERFESGPGRFNDVESLASLQFPEKVPDAAEMVRRVQSAEGAAQDARAFGSIIGGAGVLLGLAGTLMGALALRQSRTGGSPSQTNRGTGAGRAPGSRR